MSKLALISLVILGGCVPVARMSPAYFAETAPALDAGQVAVTGTAGAATDIGGSGFGASGRVRVGVGGGQELGIEGSVIATDTTVDQGIDDDGSPPTHIASRAYAARLSWKDAIATHVAIIAGVAAADSARRGGDATDATIYQGMSLAGDLGLVVSGRTFARTITPYFGARITATTPLSDPLHTGAVTELVLTGTAGMAYTLSPSTRLFTEVGANTLLDRHDGTDPDAILGGTLFATGPYAVIGLGWTIGS